MGNPFGIPKEHTDNNLDTDNDEIRETMQTAGNDDIVVTSTHVRHPVGSSVAVPGPATAKPKPSDGIEDGDENAYKTTDIIDDLNKNPGAPALMFIMGCDSRQVAMEVQKNTDVRVVVAVDRYATSGDINNLLVLVTYHLMHRTSIEQAVKLANEDYRKKKGTETDSGVTAVGKKAPQCTVYGEKRDLQMPMHMIYIEHNTPKTPKNSNP